MAENAVITSVPQKVTSENRNYSRVYLKLPSLRLIVMCVHEASGSLVTWSQMLIHLCTDPSACRAYNL